MASVAFASNLSRLEILSLIVGLEDFESARSLVAIGDTCHFEFPRNLLPLDVFAYLEVQCAKATFELVLRYGDLLGFGERSLSKKTKDIALKREARVKTYQDLVEEARLAGR
jgi:hypothetical protein